MVNKLLSTQIAQIFARIKEKKPLLHHITNFVVMNDTANVTLHVGALPVMAHAPEEMEEMVSMAGALVLNPGTLTKEWISSMLIAGKRANKLSIPIVLDPVGAGATKFRTQSNLEFLKKLKIAVLRGNSGEIGALAGSGGKVKGVESIEGVKDPATVAKQMAKRWKTVVAITGKRDVISDRGKTMYVDNGDYYLTTNTGTGCMSTTMIGAFVAVEKDYLLAATAALACYGVAAEIAAKKAQGPASFKVALLDALYNLTPGKLVQMARAGELR